jgi:hypothetical protein
MRMARGAGLAVLAAIALAPLSAGAAQHLWRFKEVYTNSTGSVQYIEMYSASDGQGVLGNHVIKVTVGAVSKTYVFPAGLAGSTFERHLLIATPGFSNVPGFVTPDYTLPCGPFIPVNATGTITIEFGVSGQLPYDTISFNASTLPLDGTNSLNDSDLTTGQNLSSATNTPTNATTTGALVLTACQANGTCDPCSDGNFCNGPETCSINACTATPPCAKQCIESTDTCVDCINAGHCNDNNVCTDDSCNGSNQCVNAANTSSCNDGAFCNGTDTCNGGVCTHTAAPCGTQNCNEGPDTCGDCQGISDCDDGQGCTVDACNSGTCASTMAADGTECDTDATFCNGVGTCASGTCGNIAEPCDTTTETCLEATDACAPAGTTPDATGPGDRDGGGGCCQSNRSPTSLTAPLLLLAVAFFVRRRRRR